MDATTKSFLIQKPRIVTTIQAVYEYTGAINDWLIIKRQLINAFPVDLRERLSKRHPISKKHMINLFDKEIIKCWKELTGVDLILDETKIHHGEW